MKAFFLVFVLTLISPALRAQQSEPIGPRYTLPTVPTIVKDGDKLTCKLDGHEFECMEDRVEYKLVSLEQWKLILLLSNQNKGLYDWRLQIQGVLDAHQQQINSYELLLKGKDQLLKIKDRDIEYYMTRLKQQTTAAQGNEMAAKIERLILYGVILGETITMFVVGVKGASQTF